MSEAQNLPFDEILKNNNGDTEEYINALVKVQESRIRKSFAYWPINKAYTENWTEKNLLMQESINMMSETMANIS